MDTTTANLQLKSCEMSNTPCPNRLDTIPSLDHTSAVFFAPSFQAEQAHGMPLDAWVQASYAHSDWREMGV